jgi:small subunit ribosomal protein S1
MSEETRNPEENKPREPQEQPASAEESSSKPPEEPSSPEKTEAPEGTAGEKKKKPPPKRRVDPGLARAYRARRPVEGKVVDVIKGGFEIRVGKSRAFCPFSQIDMHRADDPEVHRDQSYSFRIIQFRRGGEDVVLSRRALLEEVVNEEAKSVRATLIEGSLLQGHVAGISDFGVFVDLGAGVQGLVHISEVSHSKVNHAGDVVKQGDTVQVKILKLHAKGGKISLSMRQAQPDPWDGVETRFEVGKKYKGIVRRLADFGAFVEMTPGLEALAPAREFPPMSSDWTDGLAPGTELEWIVLSVDTARKRMSIFPAVEGLPEGEAEVVAGSEMTGRVQKVERFGVFIWLGPGKVGLMPTAYTGLAPGVRMDSQFQVGKEVGVEVLEITDNGRKIRLAVQGAAAEKAKAEMKDGGSERRDHRGGRDSRDSGDIMDRKGRKRNSSRDRVDPSQLRSTNEGTFGTGLGDLLKAALNKDKKE